MAGRDIVLVPGAWMGAWIWAETAEILASLGDRPHTLTLSGLKPGDALTGIGLSTHVNEVVALLTQQRLTDVVLVGHSYSGMVVGQVADRSGDRVAHSVHFESFLPRDGRSLLDDWGPDITARAVERRDVEERGAWAPPNAQGLAGEPDLDEPQRQWLAARFRDHPAGTILEPARMAAPVEVQSATFVASTHADHLPDHLVRLGEQPGWQVHTMAAGHWPMISRPTEVAYLIHRAGR